MRMQILMLRLLVKASQARMTTVMKMVRARPQKHQQRMISWQVQEIGATRRGKLLFCSRC